MNRHLAVEQIIPFALRSFRSGFENRVVFEFDRFVAADADQMMMMMRRGLVNFVMLVAFG